MGDGTTMIIVTDPWLPGIDNPYIATENEAIKGQMVSALMVTDEQRWDIDLIEDILMIEMLIL